jgi:hypothetical protein
MRNALTRPLGEIARGRLSLGVSGDGIAAIRSSAGLRSRSRIIADRTLENSADMSERLMAECRDILHDATCAGLPIHIVLADSWVRLFIVTPPANSSRLQDCRAAVALRFRSLYGEMPDEWQIAADWQAYQPFLACAMPNVLLAGLRSAAEEAHGCLVSVVPHFIAAWNRWGATVNAGQWFGAIHDSTLMLGATSVHSIAAIRSLRVPMNGFDADWLCEQTAREALRLNLPAPSQIALCGAPHDRREKNAVGKFACIHLDQPQPDGGENSAAMMLARLSLERRA